MADGTTAHHEVRSQRGGGVVHSMAQAVHAPEGVSGGRVDAEAQRVEHRALHLQQVPLLEPEHTSTPAASAGRVHNQGKATGPGVEAVG